MQFAYQVTVFVHLIGFAALLGGVLVQLRAPDPEVNRAMLVGALLELATGAALWVLAGLGASPVNAASTGGQVDHHRLRCGPGGAQP